MAKRNTFTRLAGSTYPCDCCGRLTRNTGVQGLGSKTCPQCFELAGIENEISDGYQTLEEATPQIKEYLDEIRAKGGNPAIGFAGVFGDLVDGEEGSSR
jgi:phage FluMu protein Com